MYKSIPGKEGIEAVETTLKIKNMGTRIIPTLNKKLMKSTHLSTLTLIFAIAG